MNVEDAVPDFADAEPGSIADLANTIGCPAALTILTKAYNEVRDERDRLKAELAAEQERMRAAG